MRTRQPEAAGAPRAPSSLSDRSAYSTAKPEVHPGLGPRGTRTPRGRSDLPVSSGQSGPFELPGTESEPSPPPTGAGSSSLGLGLLISKMGLTERTRGHARGRHRAGTRPALRRARASRPPTRAPSPAPRLARPPISAPPGAGSLDRGEQEGSGLWRAGPGHPGAWDEGSGPSAQVSLRGGGQAGSCLRPPGAHASPAPHAVRLQRCLGTPLTEPGGPDAERQEARRDRDHGASTGCSGHGAQDGSGNPSGRHTPSWPS